MTGTKTFGEKTWGEAATDGIEYAKNVWNWFTGDRADAEYAAFKDLVRSVVQGEEFGKDVHTTGLGELLDDDAWGRWYTNGHIDIPMVSEIPKIFQDMYEGVASAARKYSMSKEGLKQATQNYLKIHEIVESTIKPKDHDLYEATLLRALKDLGMEGLEDAREAYTAAMATYKVRERKGDSMINKVGSYFKDLKEDVAGMFGEAEPEPVAI